MKQTLPSTNHDSIVESLLFVSNKPISIGKLSKLTNLTKKELKSSLDKLSSFYEKNSRGLSLLNTGDTYQLVTSPKNKDYVAKLVSNEVEGDLSTAALETLAIVAYKGPVQKIEIEKIRGVNCLYSIRNLRIRGLVEKIADKNDNRSYLYQVTPKFLKHFNLKKVSDLDDYQKINSTK